MRSSFDARPALTFSLLFAAVVALGACGSSEVASSSSAGGSSTSSSATASSTSSTASASAGGGSTTSSSAGGGSTTSSTSASSGGGGAGGGGGGGACAHAECAAGAALDPLCSSCATVVCNVRPGCCTSGWDEACVVEAQLDCGNLCGAPAMCTHDECALGGALLASCSPCAYDVCTTMPSCCTGNWDDACIKATYPWGACTCPKPPPPCVHSECAIGQPLDPQCSTCAAAVCQDDPACCNGNWDASCLGLTKNHPMECACAASCGHDECAPGGALAPGCSACADFVCQGDVSCCSSNWTASCVSLAAGVAACACQGAPGNGPPLSGGTTDTLITTKNYIGSIAIDAGDVYFAYLNTDATDPLASSVYRIAGGSGLPQPVAPASVLTANPNLVTIDADSVVWALGPFVDQSGGGIVRLKKGDTVPVALVGAKGFGSGPIQEVLGVQQVFTDANNVYWLNTYLPQGMFVVTTELYRISKQGGASTLVATSAAAADAPPGCALTMFTSFVGVDAGYLYYTSCQELLRKPIGSASGDGTRELLSPTSARQLVLLGSDVLGFEPADLLAPDPSKYEPLILMRHPAAGGAPTPFGATVATLAPPQWLSVAAGQPLWFEAMPPDSNAATGFMTAPNGGPLKQQAVVNLGSLDAAPSGLPTVQADATGYYWAGFDAAGTTIQRHTPF